MEHQCHEATVDIPLHKQRAAWRGLSPKDPKEAEWGIAVWEGQDEEGKDEHAARKDDQDASGCRRSVLKNW